MNKALPLVIDPQNIPLDEMQKQSRKVKKPRKTKTNPADKLKIRDVKTGKTQKQQESDDKANRDKVFKSVSELIDEESKSRNALPLNNRIGFSKTYQTMSNQSLNNGMSVGYDSDHSATEVFKYVSDNELTEAQKKKKRVSIIKKSSSDNELTQAQKKKQEYNRTYRTRAQLKKLIDIPTLEQTLKGEEESKDDADESKSVTTPPVTPLKQKKTTSTKKKKSKK